jgi:hypothetical protein
LVDHLQLIIPAAADDQLGGASVLIIVADHLSAAVSGDGGGASLPG